MWSIFKLHFVIVSFFLNGLKGIQMIDKYTKGFINATTPVRKCNTCFWPRNGSFMKYHQGLMTKNEKTIGKLLAHESGENYQENWRKYTKDVRAQLLIKGRTYLTDYYRCQSALGCQIELQWNGTNWLPEFTNMTHAVDYVWAFYHAKDTPPTIEYILPNNSGGILWENRINYYVSGELIDKVEVEEGSYSLNTHFDLEKSITLSDFAHDDVIHILDAIFGFEFMVVGKVAQIIPYTYSDDDLVRGGNSFLNRLQSIKLFPG